MSQIGIISINGPLSQIPAYIRDLNEVFNVHAITTDTGRLHG
jgi:hypothetical protein